MAKAVNPPKVIKYQESPEKDANIKSDKEVMKVANDVEPYVKDVNLCIKDDLEGIKLVKDISEIKSKLRKLESKLGEVSAQTPFFFTLCLLEKRD